MHPLPSNLRRIRADRGLTQAQLATKARISTAAYRKVETGRSAPRASTLDALAHALDARYEELLVEPPRLDKVRFRSSKKLKSREQVIVDIAFRLRDFCALEDTLNERPVYALAGLEPPTSRDREGLAGLADRARKALGLAAPDQSIRDVCGLLENNGIKVLLIRRASDGFFGLSVAPGRLGPAIVVNTWERISVERRIYTAAHELGHLLLSRDEYDGGEDSDRDAEHEREVDLFAALFLMPDEVFWSEWKQSQGLPLIDRVLKVKRIFKVSYKTVLHRIAEQMDDPSAIWPLFQVQHKQRFGKTLKKWEEPKGLAASEFSRAAPPALQSREHDALSASEFTPDRLHRLVRRAFEEGEISMSRAAEILRIDLMDMRKLAASWI